MKNSVIQTDFRLLVALFLTYQVSITMFTHVHIINGVMIVHSHPSSDDHHTHTAGQVITIAHIGSYQTPEPEAGVSNVTVECPLLYVLGLNTNTFRAVAPHTHCVHLRAPPAYC